MQASKRIEPEPTKKSPVKSPSCTDPNVDSRRGPHARFWIARLGSVHLPVGNVTDTRERRSRHLSFYDPKVEGG
ncbi:hypothetical protein CRG98_018672 [Punica granatum]|uniref:Uncharacterized protein n=1 Tax=Punica granatum TaxID=22663 RepID=A0A2I0JZP2_PUNGR|nr:hypothetical protein CRG98_018672 [Punica granatum]